MICRRCHKVLTAPKSVQRGLGPVCAKKECCQMDLFEKKHTVSGRFSGDIVCKRLNGTPTVNIEQSTIFHSPDGFEWGYSGSGPADLALNILLRFTTRENAFALHQSFKVDFISGMNKDGGVITEGEIVAWLENKLRIA